MGGDSAMGGAAGMGGNAMGGAGGNDGTDGNGNPALLWLNGPDGQEKLGPIEPTGPF
jgi:hypothetical protein